MIKVLSIKVLSIKVLSIKVPLGLSTTPPIHYFHYWLQQQLSQEPKDKAVQNCAPTS